MLSRAFRAALAALAALLAGSEAAAQTSELDIALAVYSDPGGDLSVNEVRALDETGAFQPIEGLKRRMGYIEGALWVKAVLSARSNAQHFILEIPSPRTAYVEFYEADDIEPLRAGAGFPFAQRPLQWLTPAFPVDVSQGNAETVYLRIRDSEDFTLQMKVWQWRAFVRHATFYMLEHGAAAGMLFVLTVFNGGIYLVLRERGHLFIAAFLAAYALYYSAHEGIGPLILWPNWPWLGERAVTVFGALGLLTGAGLARELLDIPHDAAALRRAARFWLVVLTLVFVATLVAPPEWRGQALLYAGLLTPLGVIALGVASYRHGGKSVMFFLRIWSILAAGVFVVALGGLGLIPGIHTVQFFSYAIILATLAWTFELAWRLKAREIELRIHLAAAVEEKTAALGEVKALETLLPICSHCKKIRDDDGAWQPIEKYLKETGDADLTHGICPDCAKTWYPGIDLSDASAS